MKKVTLILLLTLMTHFGFSQVGINTTTPNAQLDIRSSNQITPANNDGILIPKIDAFPLTNPTVAQQGMMVYLTTLSAGKTRGFYYWDNVTASWLGLGGDKGWDLPGNTISDTLKFVGTTNSVDLIFKSYNHRGGRIGNTNTSIGRNALNPMVTGNDNSAFGKNALNMAGSGMGNSGFGSGSLKAITSGNQNTAMGYNSLMANSTGGENTALGFNAMIVNSSGFANTAVGSQSLYSTNGSNNVGIGYFAGSSITSGSGNIAIGLNAQVPAATGNSQLSIGNVVYGADMDSTLLGKIGIGVAVPTEKLEVAGKTKTTNLQVTNGAIAGNVLTSDALGNATWQSPSVTSAWNLTGNSGYNPATSFIGSIDSKEVFFRHTNQPSGVIGVSDTGFGYRSGGVYSLIAKNTAVGSLAAESNTVSTENSAFGSEALNKNTAGSKNVAIGNKALFNQAFSNGGVEFDTNNTVVGYAAMYNTNSTSPSIGTYNTALGNYALSNNATGSSNVAVGASALGAIWTGLGIMSGNRNVAVGTAAIKNLTTGNDNLAVGYLSLNYNTTGSSNVSIGTDALFYSSEQSNGTAIGTRAMQNYAIFQPAGTNDNVAVGYESLRGTSTVGLHFKNTAIGYQSMTANVTGSFNTSLGHKTLFTNTSGATNTALGNSALYLNSIGSGNIAIGNEAGYNETGSNKLYIENSNSTAPLIYGEFDTDLIRINGRTESIYSQLTANGDGQSSIYGYRTRDSQNDGVNYSRTGTNKAVSGYNYWGDLYTFGVTGHCFNDYTRTGGVLGADANGAYWGSLGYKNSGGALYGIYATAVLATGTGRFSQPQNAFSIGGGFYGDIIGSWSKGTVFGHISSGTLFASYNSGDEYTSGKQIELVDTGASKTAAYTVTSTESVIYNKGKINLQNGSARVSFDRNYTKLLGDIPVVTTTPMGQCNGLYIESVDKNGFTIRELNNGTSNVAVSWIVVGDRIDANSSAILESVLDKDFDTNINEVMFNENNVDQHAKAIWAEGNTIQFGQLPKSFSENTTKEME